MVLDDALLADGSSPVLVRKMPLKIPAIVNDAGNFDRAVLAAAIQKKMAGLHHPYTTYSGPAERNVVRSRAFDHDLREFLGAWPLRVRFDIEQGLPDERRIAQRSLHSEFLKTPPQNGGDVAASMASDVKI